MIYKTTFPLSFDTPFDMRSYGLDSTVLFVSMPAYRIQNRFAIIKPYCLFIFCAIINDGGDPVEGKK